MKNIKQNKGITLIALVITIIVLLILAGVAINTLMGENGILKQASTAKESNKKAEVEEAIDLMLNEWKINNKTEGISIEDFFQKKKADGEITKFTDNSDGTYTVVKDGYRMTISSEGKRIGETTLNEIVKVEANTEDWDFDEATGTITFKEGGTYKSGNTYDTLVIPNYYDSKPVKKIDNPNGQIYYIGSTKNIKAKKIIVSEGIEEIGNRALGSIGAEEIYLPDTLSKIGEYAFYYNNITEIFIPKSVFYMGQGVFSSCSKIQSINCEDTIEHKWDLSWTGKSGYDSRVHYGVSNPNSEIVATKVEANTEDWEFDEATATITFKEGGTYKSGNIYDTLVIPNYYDGNPVKRIANPSKYSSSYYISSSYCSNVKAKKIIISEGIEEIGGWSLGFIEAEEIVLPNSLKVIGRNALSGNSMTEIFIPKNVINMEWGVLGNCSNLTSINCEASSAPWNTSWASGYDSKVHWGMSR